MCEQQPCLQGPYTLTARWRDKKKESLDVIFTPMPQSSKSSKENLLLKEGNPGSLPGRGSLLLPRAHEEDSLVCSQGHCRGHQGAPGLLPSKASSHSLHSDHNPVCWNPQHACHKALWAKGNTLALNTPSGLTSALTQSLPDKNRPNYCCESETPRFQSPLSWCWGSNIISHWRLNSDTCF